MERNSFKEIFGVKQQNKFDWRNPVSLFSAFMFGEIIALIMTIILLFLPDIFQKADLLSHSLHAFFSNILLITTTITVLRYIKIKNDIIKIILISLVLSLFSLFIEKGASMSISLHFLESFTMMFTMFLSWHLLISRMDKKRLVLVVGYIVSAIVGIIFMFWQLSNEHIETTRMIRILGTTFMFNIFWVFEFWIGLLIFDRIFKINKSTASIF